MLKGNALPVAIGLTTLLMTPLWLQHVFSTDGGRRVRACDRMWCTQTGRESGACPRGSPIPSAGNSRASTWNINDPVSLCARLYDTLLLAQG